MSLTNLEEGTAAAMAASMELELKHAAGIKDDSMLHMAQRIERSQHFQIMCSVGIISNAIYIACVTEYHAQHASPQIPVWQNVLDFCFCSFFASEICFRMIARKWTFFFASDIAWNVFDLLIVITSAIELLFSDGAGANSFSYLRITRVARVLKILRAVRIMRQFRELRMVLDSLLGSVRAIGWTAVLVLVVTYVFAIAFVQAATHATSGPLPEWVAAEYGGPEIAITYY